jgi:hypothetical protein
VRDRFARAGQFVFHQAQVDRECAVGRDLLDHLAVGIVLVRGRFGQHAHADQPVFDIEGLRVGPAALDAQSHVAVGVVVDRADA